MRYFLVDNGSLRAESVLNFRRIASELSQRSGLEIIPASLLHSSKVPAEELDGIAAVNLERRMKQFLEAGEREFTLIPFFIGPSAAIVDYFPKRLARLREKYGETRMVRTNFLYMEGEQEPDTLSKILEEGVRKVIDSESLECPKVALVDHGSPLATVTAVRDALAVELAESLGNEVECVAASSMERREGDEYAFNEPLLERLLDEPGWRYGPVVICMVFLSPGRHAGPEGDVAGICEDAKAGHPKLKTYMTELMGLNPRIIPLLARRLEGHRIPL